MTGGGKFQLKHNKEVKLNLLKVSSAAKKKGVSRQSVYAALAYQHINGQRIDGVLFVINNRKFERWTPKGGQ